MLDPLRALAGAAPGAGGSPAAAEEDAAGGKAFFQGEGTE